MAHEHVRSRFLAEKWPGDVLRHVSRPNNAILGPEDGPGLEFHVEFAHVDAHPAGLDDGDLLAVEVAAFHGLVHEGV